MADTATAPTATATPSAPAAAQSSAPASAPTAAKSADVKRPTSFGAALRTAEKEESSPSSTAAASTETPAAATVLPTDATSPAGPKGPVPYERFSEVNTRLKAAEDRAKQVEKDAQAYAWAKGMDRDAIAQSVQWHARATTDFPGFVRDLLATAPADRQAQVRSEFARQLATRTDAEPQPDLQTDTGAPVYSAKQQAEWMAWRERRLQESFDKRLEPMQRELAQGRQERQQVQQAAKARSFAGDTMKEATEWPHFTEHVADIAAEYAKQPGGSNESEELLALHRAYLSVLKAKVFPSISTKAQASVLAELQTKAVAGTEQPGRATTVAPTKPKSLGEALKREADRAGWR